MRLTATLMASAFVLGTAIPAGQAAAQADPVAPPPVAPEATGDVTAPGLAPAPSEPAPTEPAPAIAADPPPAGTSAVTTTALNLRSGPGTEHGSIEVIPAGASVQVETCLGEGWCQVSYAGTTGFASQQYLQAEGTAPPVAAGQPVAPVTESILPDPAPGAVDPGAVAEPAPPATAPAPATDLAPTIADPGTTLADPATVADPATTLTEPAPPLAADDPVPSAAPVTQELQPVQGTAQTTASLNLRSGPGTEHPALTVIPEGAEVELLGCTADGEWCRVSYDGATGFAAASFLSG